MRKSFTLIELIFVLVLIGLLASIAVPKFLEVEISASKSKIKSTISAVTNAVENIHGMWLINDNFNWNSNCDFNNTTGYPHNLDKNRSKLFSCVLKQPVNSCSFLYSSNSAKYTNCLEEVDDNVYKYYFSPTGNDFVKFQYQEENGSFECLDEGLGKEACEKIIF